MFIDPLPMVLNFFIIVLCQIGGNAVVRFLDVPIPGPVVGLLLLFSLLIVRGGIPAGMDRGTTPLLRHMSLLFIPAGTGVLMHLDLIRDEWLPVVAVIAVTTPLALLITAAALRLCMPTADAKGEANRRNQP